MYNLCRCHRTGRRADGCIPTATVLKHTARNEKDTLGLENSLPKAPQMLLSGWPFSIPLQSERRFGPKDPEGWVFWTTKSCLASGTGWSSWAQGWATEPLRTPTPCPRHLEGGKLQHRTSPTRTPLPRRSNTPGLAAGELGPVLPQLQRSARLSDLSPSEFRSSFTAPRSLPFAGRLQRKSDPGRLELREKEIKFPLHLVMARRQEGCSRSFRNIRRIQVQAQRELAIACQLGHVGQKGFISISKPSR